MKDNKLIVIIVLSILIAIIGISAILTNSSNMKQIEAYKQENDVLKATIEDLKKTDQYYFTMGVEALNKAKKTKTSFDYNEAKGYFTTLISRFPKSPYVGDTNTNIKEIDTALETINKIDNLKNSINEKIYKGDFSGAKADLNKLSSLISQGEYNDISKEIYEAENKPIVVAPQELIANHDKYWNKRVTLNVQLKMKTNNIKRKCFNTYLSTGTEFYEYDMDVRMEIFYGGMPDVTAWQNLSSDNSPVITQVTGTFLPYSNDLDSGYISAESIQLQD